MPTTRSYHQEAMRYIDNAKQQLMKSSKSGNYYTDLELVKSAGGIVYSGIEQAAKWYIELKGYTIAKNATGEEISIMLSRIDGEALMLFNDLHSYFYAAVYYHGHNNVKVLKESFLTAVKFVDLLLPFDRQEEYS